MYCVTFEYKAAVTSFHLGLEEPNANQHLGDPWKSVSPHRNSKSTPLSLLCCFLVCFVLLLPSGLGWRPLSSEDFLQSEDAADSGEALGRRCSQLKLNVWVANLSKCLCEANSHSPATRRIKCIASLRSEKQILNQLWNEVVSGMSDFNVTLASLSLNK